jgi:hypothetical protein
MNPRSMVALLATLLLASCASVSGPTKVLPPWELLQPCGSTYPTPSTNGELARQRNDLLDALRGCNKDKESLREWATQ